MRLLAATTARPNHPGKPHEHNGPRRWNEHARSRIVTRIGRLRQRPDGCGVIDDTILLTPERWETDGPKRDSTPDAERAELDRNGCNHGKVRRVNDWHLAGNRKVDEDNQEINAELQALKGGDHIF